MTGCKVIFASAAKQKSLLHSNKRKLLPNRYPGLYELSCDCGEKNIGETKKLVLTRSIEDEEDNMTKKMESVGSN